MIAFERFRLDGLWRIKGKHSIRGTYFKNDRTGTNELSRDINFGDETYPLGATTTARWQLEVMQVSYDYAFKRSDKYELAAGIGLHVLHANLGMDATITGAGGSASRELSREWLDGRAAAGAGPARHLAVAARFLLHGPGAIFLHRLQRLQRQPFRSENDHRLAGHAAFWVGLGYNDFRFRFDLDKELFDGRLRWNYGGAMAFASVTF